MTIAKVTSKGQVTIPLEVRQKLGLETGSRIDFVLNSEGHVTIEPVQSSVRSLEGVFHSARRRPVSVEDMDHAIAAEVAGETDKKPIRAAMK